MCCCNENSPDMIWEFGQRSAVSIVWEGEWRHVTSKQVTISSSNTPLTSMFPSPRRWMLHDQLVPVYMLGSSDNCLYVTVYVLGSPDLKLLRNTDFLLCQLFQATQASWSFGGTYCRFVPTYTVSHSGRQQSKLLVMCTRQNLINIATNLSLLINLSNRIPDIPTVTLIVGRVIAQAVSRQLPTVAARVRGQVRSRGICGRQTVTGAGFLLRLLFPLPIVIPLTAPRSSSIIRGWYNRPVSGRSTKWTQSHPTPKKKEPQTNKA
jgi:hypothetical protein